MISKKAFDSVEWSFIQDTLNIFNFGPNFTSWSKIMYNDITACVMNNGYSSPFFKITRGIRQGCPLSAYLFLLVAEILAAGIRENPHISGFKIGNQELCTVQMADDTTLCLDGPLSLHRSLLLFTLFGSFSGLKINISKSEAMGLGKYSKLFTVKPYGLAWKEKNLYSLGITFSKNPNETIEVNFNNKITKIQNSLNMWSQRHLSIKGKITIIKSLILPQILYISANLAVPEWFVSKTNSMLYHFVWSAKMDKVKRVTLVNKIEKGGLKMIDLECMFQAQRVMWVKRFFKQSDGAGWMFFFHYVCTKLNLCPMDVFKCDFHPEYLRQTWPLFYHQMLFSWFYYKDTVGLVTAWDIRRKLFIYNRSILIQNRYVADVYVQWFHAGIRQIHNLYDYKGYPYPLEYLENQFSIKIDVMRYNSLISAIPSDWKRLLKNAPIHSNAISYDELPHTTINDKSYPVTLISNQSVYWSLIKNITQPPISVQAWELLFGDEIDWSKTFRIPYDVTFDTRLQSFQYKILLRIFPCNWYVSKFDRTVVERCQFCSEGIDNICHYFFDCTLCTHFWEDLQVWISDNVNIDNLYEGISRKNVVLGICSKNENYCVINYIILYAKFFIFIKKKNNAQILRLYEFINFLRCKLNVNLIIAKHQNQNSIIQKMCKLSTILGLT